MKKLLFSISAIVGAFLVTAGIVLAHHNTITQSASCQGYSISAEYVGGSSVRRVLTAVQFTLDSVIQNIDADWRGVSEGFTIFSRTGTGNHGVDVTGTVKLYGCDDTNISDSLSNGTDNLWTDGAVYKCDNNHNEHNSDNGWDLIETDTFNTHFHGQCASPTPSPSLSPSPSPSATPPLSPSPSPSVNPSHSPSPSTPPPTCEELENCEPTPTPSATPTPTPTSTPAPNPTPQPPAREPEYVCPVTQVVANPLIKRNGDEAIIQWQPTQGDKANIYYKENKSPVWQHSVIGVPNNGYYDRIRGLGSLDITFAIQQECGPLSKIIIDGPTSVWVLFR